MRREFRQSIIELRQGQQNGIADMAQLAVKLFGTPHVEH
jgi:hypothetical protein